MREEGAGVAAAPRSPADLLEAGRTALARGAWAEACALFAAAVREQPSAAALEGLSWAAWWLNDEATMFDARERAYRAYRMAGDRCGAARMAAWLGTDHVDFRGELAVAQGWLGRARRLLADIDPGVEHGWLAVHEAEKYLHAHDTVRARELGARATALGRAGGVVDLEMMGLATEGLALVTEGRLDEGMASLDQAVAAAVGGEFTEVWSAGWAGCYMLYACERVHDYDRAAQWCRRIEEWSARSGMHLLGPVCRAHYAGVLIWRGTWPEAEAELARAAERLGVLRPPLAAEAVVRLGDLRRRQGRLDEAAEIFAEVEDHPLALLGIGELELDEGHPAAARDRAAQYLRNTPPSARTLRAAGLELLVRALVPLGETQAATAAAEELAAAAAAVATEPLRASACLAAGTLAAATGDAEAARIAFEDAVRLFHRCDGPYEAARARIELARVLAAQDRPRDAIREARAAATALRRIGAAREAERADALAGELDGRRAPCPLTRREREVLRLVAAGKGDRAIAAELVLSEHTVHRHVANILVKLGCPSRTAAVAEALRAGLM